MILNMNLNQHVAIYFLVCIALMILSFAWRRVAGGFELIIIGTFAGVLLGASFAVVIGLVYLAITGTFP